MSFTLLPAPLLLLVVDSTVPAGSDAQVAVLMMVRWLHFVSGITWIGLLYFFNLVNAPFLQSLDAPTMGRIFAPLMSRALWWFRWSALVTVLAGLYYWGTIVSADAHNAPSAGGAHPSVGFVLGTFLGIWTAAWVIGFLLVCIARVDNLWVVCASFLVVAAAAGWAFVRCNDHGWESNRLLAIGVGGGMGWWMLLNVWGVIWRFGKRLILWREANVAEGAPMPGKAASYARQNFLMSRANFVLSFPMLFFMGAASHFPLWKQ